MLMWIIIWYFNNTNKEHSSKSWRLKYTIWRKSEAYPTRTILRHSFLMLLSSRVKILNLKCTQAFERYLFKWEFPFISATFVSTKKILKIFSNGSLFLADVHFNLSDLFFYPFRLQIFHKYFLEMYEIISVLLNF